MKKATALLLILTMLLALYSALGETETEAEATPVPPAADYLDVSVFEKYPEIFSIGVTEDGNTGVIAAKGSSSDRAFSTPYDTPEYYSVIVPCLYVVRYAEETARTPVLVINISYRGTKPLNIASVSFIGGVRERRDYRVTAEAQKVSEEGKAAEDMVLVIGREAGRAGLLMDLASEGLGYGIRLKEAAGGKSVSTELPDWKLILHGDEDVEVKLPAAFWTELSALINGVVDANAFPLLGSIGGNSCDAVPVE